MDEASNSENYDVINHWQGADIAENVADIVSENMKNTGMIYDEESGLYFDSILQCYYNPNCRLYYHKGSKAFYTYDLEANTLNFHSFCEEENYLNLSQSTREEGYDFYQDKEKNNANKMGSPSKMYFDEESNEIVDSETIHRENNTIFLEEMRLEDKTLQSSKDLDKIKYRDSPRIELNGNEDCNEELLFSDAPCLKAIVTSSDVGEVSVGTQYFITWPGGTIGRTENHTIRLSDQLVSKNHAIVSCNLKNGSYIFEIKDNSSTNGTFLNGIRLQQDESKEIHDRSKLKIGNVSLLCHIHILYEACSVCEGIVHAKEIPNNSLTRKTSRWSELNKIREKYGLKAGERFEGIRYRKYTDRAQERRETKGSSHDSEKTEVTSMEEPIDHRNIGYIMLKKMGWNAGDPLGQ